VDLSLPQMPKSLCRRDFFGLAAFLVCLALLNLVWHATHVQPVNAGQNLLEVALDQLEATRENPGYQLELLLRMVGGPSQSWYNLSALGGMAFFGRTYRGLAFTSTLYYLALVLALFLLGGRLAGRRTAWVAAVLAALLPAAVSWSRLFSPNIALMAVSAWAALCLHLTDWWRRPLPALGFVLLAVLSTKMAETVGENLQNLLVLFPLALYTLIVRLALIRQKQFRALLVVLATAGVFLGAMNFTYLVHISGYLWQEGVELADQAYGGGSIAHGWQGWVIYPVLLWKLHLLPFFTLLLLAAHPLLLHRPDRQTGFALTYLWAPLLIFTLISKKNYNYAFAFLPATPLLIALGWGKITARRPARLMGATALVVALIIAGRLSFVDRPPARPEAGATGVSPRSTMISRLNHLSFYPRACRDYPPERIAQSLAAAAGERGGLDVLVLGGLGDMDVTLFLTLVRLADADRLIHVHRAGFNTDEYLMRRETRVDPAADVQFADPAAIVVYASAAMLDEQRVCRPERFFGQDPHFDHAAGGPETGALLHRAAEVWCGRLNEIPWNQYTGDIVEFPSGQPFREVNSFVYYRQDGRPPR